MKKIIILFVNFLTILCSFAQNNNMVVSDAELNKTLSVYRERYSEHSPQFADCVQWCAMQCAMGGDNKQAASLLKESDLLFKKYGTGVFQGRDTINEIFRNDVLSRIEKNADRDYYAIRYTQKSLKLKQQYFGTESEQVLNALLDLSQLYAERRNYKKAASIHNMGYNSYVGLLKREFCSSSESKRNAYWKTASRYVTKTLTETQKYGGRTLSSQSSMASAAYNANLLSKGILLNTTIHFENYVRNCGSAEAMRLLNERKASSDMLVQDSLDYEILRVLNEEGKPYSIPQLSISWQDVANQLADNDVAIEFYRTSLKEYGALIIKKGWKAPQIVKLNTYVKIGREYKTLENSLQSIIDDLKDERLVSQESMWALSQAIWTDKLISLLPEEADAKVYFSADGLLQLVGLESLPFNNPNGSSSANMSDIYKMYRLSSTRVLAYDRTRSIAQEHATLYGDILYDVEDSIMKCESQQYAGKRGITRHFRGAINDVIPQLPQTRLEVDLIASTLIQNGKMQVDTLMREKGNEESFKNLHGIQQKILHIATHGFYYPDDYAFYNSDSTQALIDHSMQRTGLLLAGAQKAISENFIPEGVEDGILTAYEISQVDLSHLEIAILSACETALGDITTDGVAGLQRGFKKAGANSILMSLWKVDDAATCKLMTEFYSNWIGKKMTKHDALEAAKRTVRETKGWEDPKYWAAFILLDGLD